jgi:hypothetical protein
MWRFSLFLARFIFLFLKYTVRIKSTMHGGSISQLYLDFLLLTIVY